HDELHGSRARVRAAARVRFPCARRVIPRGGRPVTVTGNRRDPAAASPGGSAPDREQRTLRERALAAMDRAYAPYSSIPVRAVVEASPGREIVCMTRGGREERCRLADLLPVAFPLRSLDQVTE